MYGLIMFERRRLIISMILAINLYMIVWRISWQDVSFATTLEADDSTSVLLPLQQQGNMSGNLILDEKQHIATESQFALSTRMTAMSASPIYDPHRLIDLKNFEYIQQQAACSRRIQALIIVHSAHQNFGKRMAIRSTWADRRSLRLTPLRVLFFIGNIHDEKRQRQLIKENEKYADMVQGNFMDTYRNITYKHVMALKWFLQKCAHAQLLIKTDDDIFVNTPLFVKYANEAKLKKLNKHKSTKTILQANATALATSVKLELFNQPQRLIFCHKIVNSLPKRTYRSKWRVSYKEFAEKVYPPYCLGYAIVYSNDVVARLYVSAQQHKYFWIDDVHVTGTLTQLNGIEIRDGSQYILSDRKRDELFRNELKADELDFLFTTYGIDSLNMRILWTYFNLNEVLLQTTRASLIDSDSVSASTANSTSPKINKLLKKETVSARTFNHNHNENPKRNRNEAPR